jgi:hypothetical protein
MPRRVASPTRIHMPTYARCCQYRHGVLRACCVRAVGCWMVMMIHLGEGCTLTQHPASTQIPPRFHPASPQLHPDPPSTHARTRTPFRSRARGVRGRPAGLDRRWVGSCMVAASPASPPTPGDDCAGRTVNRGAPAHVCLGHRWCPGRSAVVRPPLHCELHGRRAGHADAAAVPGAAPQPRDRCATNH